VNKYVSSSLQSIVHTSLFRWFSVYVSQLQFVLKHDEYRNDGSFPEFWTTKDNSLDYRLSKIKDVLVFNTIVKSMEQNGHLLRPKREQKIRGITRNVTAFVSNENKKRNSRELSV